MVMGVLTVVAFFLLTFGTGASLPIRMVVSVAMGVGGGLCLGQQHRQKALGADGRTASRRGGTDGSLACVWVTPSRPLCRSSPKKCQTRLGSEMGVISDEAAYGRDVGEALKAHGRAHGYAGLALPCGGRDDPADLGW